MTIAVIGWGSLIWNPESLRLASPWFKDGPCVPVEFARQSNDGRLTLVVHGDKRVQTLWAELPETDIDAARQVLGWREGCVKRSNNTLLSRHIGWWTPDGRSKDLDYPFGHDIDIEDWANSKGLAGAVWTALPPKFLDTRGRAPSQTQAIEYLASLKGPARDLAFEYIRKAPKQIQTPYREAFENRFKL